MAAARVVACLLAAVMCLSCGEAAAARSPAARMHRHLKRLNKPAVKSIEVCAPAELPRFLLTDPLLFFPQDLNGGFVFSSFLPGQSRCPFQSAFLGGFGRD
jgi:hypothetical protein